MPSISMNVRYIIWTGDCSLGGAPAPLHLNGYLEHVNYIAISFVVTSRP
jgi:hypothetical protein